MHMGPNIKLVFTDGRCKWPKNGQFWPKISLTSSNKYIHTIPECAGVIDIYFINGYSRKMVPTLRIEVADRGSHFLNLDLKIVPLVI